MPKFPDVRTASLGDCLRSLAACKVNEARSFYAALRQELRDQPPLVVMPSWMRDEWSYLAHDGHAFHLEGTQAAVAANLSFIQIFNPSSSGVLLTVWEYVATPVQHQVRRHNAQLGAVVAGAENASLGGPAGVCEVRAGSELAASGSILYNRGLYITGLSIAEVHAGNAVKPMYLVPPGQSVFWECTIVNNAVSVHVFFTETALPDYA